MSHILSALERAAADRERQELPGLRLVPAAPARADDIDDEPAAGTSPPWPLLAAAGAISAALAWWYFGARAAPRPAPPEPQPVVQVAPSNVAVPDAVVPAPAPVPAVAQAPATAVPAPAADGPGPLGRVVAAATAPRHAAEPAAGETNAPVPPRSRRIHAEDELPPQVRRELPTLAISLWMHSDVPANRMVVVNGRSYREGARVAPHLWLERIGPGTAVFRYKGWRYRVGS